MNLLWISFLRNWSIWNKIFNNFSLSYFIGSLGFIKKIHCTFFSCFLYHRSKYSISSKSIILRILNNQQVRVSILNNFPVLHHHHFVIVNDCSQTMSYSENRAVLELVFKSLLDELIRLKVNISSSLVKENDLTLLKSNSC